MKSVAARNPKLVHGADQIKGNRGKDKEERGKEEEEEGRGNLLSSLFPFFPFFLVRKKSRSFFGFPQIRTTQR